MTKQDYTALVFVVDRSGSMASIAKDMEGGISTLLKTQSELPGELTVDYIRFDTEIEHVYKAEAPENVKVRIDARGGTALNDAIGFTINTVGNRFAGLAEEERPSQVIVAIVTDGYENASREFNRAKVKEMVQHQTDKYDWNFMYLGANQDAVLVADGFGIAKGSALTWNPNNAFAASATMDSYVTSTRSGIAYNFTEADRLANQ